MASGDVLASYPAASVVGYDVKDSNVFDSSSGKYVEETIRFASGVSFSWGGYYPNNPSSVSLRSKLQSGKSYSIKLVEN